LISRHSNVLSIDSSPALPGSSGVRFFFFLFFLFFLELFEIRYGWGTYGLNTRGSLPVRRLWISMCQVMGGVIGESVVGSGSRDAYHRDKSEGWVFGALYCISRLHAEVRVYYSKRACRLSRGHWRSQRGYAMGLCLTCRLGVINLSTQDEPVCSVWPAGAHFPTLATSPDPSLRRAHNLSTAS
jgi:hypothetical protein